MPTPNEIRTQVKEIIQSYCVNHDYTIHQRVAKVREALQGFGVKTVEELPDDMLVPFRTRLDAMMYGEKQ